MDKPTISIIGTGKLGSTLALALAQKGYTINGLWDNDSSRLQETVRAVNPVRSDQDPAAAARGSEIVILAGSDDSIRPVSDQLASRQALSKGQIICHCSGFLPSAVLVANKMLGASIASLHPLASFSRQLSPWDRFGGCYFGLEGDAAAMGRLRLMVESLDCRPVDVPASRKSLYHVSSVMASNYLAALLYAAEGMMGAAVDDKAQAADMLGSLARTVMENIGQDGPAGSLSGPIERGDLQTVSGHLESLKKDFPQGIESYKALGRLMLKVARQRHPERAEWDAMSRLLD